LRQGRASVSSHPLLAAIVATSAALLIAATPAAPAARSASGSTNSQSSGSTPSRAKNSLRQFTGYVTAIDKTTLTVEKRGKKPRSMVFTKDPEMKTTGEVEKDARVTVYYREDGGRAVARRVVVRPEAGGTKGGK
jgi:hypothetical protein